MSASLERVLSVSGVRAHHLRGAAMAETIVTIGFMLTLMVGVVQLAFAGYYQAQLDGATFFYSHEYALTNATQSSVLTNDFPNVPPANVSTTTQYPPNIEINDPTGAEVLGEYTTGGTPNGSQSSSSNRYGGASLLVPQLINTTASMPLPTLRFADSAATSWILPVNVLAQANLYSGNIEGRTMVAAHDDDAPGTAYNSSASNNNLELPGAYDQNTPPYYFAMSYMWYCKAGPTCGNPVSVDLGLGAYLQDYSFAGAQNGNYQNPVNGLSNGAQFYALAYHQQKFVSLAGDLPSSLTSINEAFNPFQSQAPYWWDEAPCGNSNYGRTCPTDPLQ